MPSIQPPVDAEAAPLQGESRPETPTPAALPLPAGANPKGRPLPEDRFIVVGRCAGTGQDITLCYTTIGDPTHPCLLLVNGLATTRLSWRNEFCDALVAAGFYVITFDNRDCGLSTHVAGTETPHLLRMYIPTVLPLSAGSPPYTLQHMAHDALNLLSKLHVKRAFVLGTSMGCMIAQQMAIVAPERLLGMIAIFGHSSSDFVKGPTLGMMLSFLDKPASNSLNDLIEFRLRTVRRFVGDYTLDEEGARARAARIIHRSPADPAAMGRQIWAIQRAESRLSGLRALTGSFPTLIIHGMKDTLIPWENSVELSQTIMNSKLVLFPRMGHSIVPELESEIVAEIALMLQQQR